jgi:protein-disulfide isomerase
LNSPGQRLFVALALAAILVGAAIVVSQGGSNDDAEVSDEPAEIADRFAGIEQDGMMLGDPAAELTVLEFADPQCPFCADFAADGLPGVIDDYVRPGTIRLDFAALTFIGPDSEAMARLIAAASLQDHAWETIDLLYARQGTENSGYATEEFLAEAAADVPGLDAEQVLAARDSPEVDALLDAAQRSAERLGINSTPTFVAVGEVGESQVLDLGALDADAFAGAIDLLLTGG